MLNRLVQVRVSVTLYVLFIVYHSNSNKIFIICVFKRLEKLNFWIVNFLKDANINLSYFLSIIENIDIIYTNYHRKK